jgi:putative spermidine/putrescine transport system permease protein
MEQIPPLAPLHADLRRQLARLERHRTRNALLLMAPALVLILGGFLLPIALVLYRSVANDEVARTLPLTVAALHEWDGTNLPGEQIYAQLATDLRHGFAERSLGSAGRRLNLEITGFLSLILSSGQKLSHTEIGPGEAKTSLIASDSRWGEPRYWAVLKRNTATLTDFYFLSALDLRRNAGGSIERVPEERALYVDMLLRSVSISLTVTVLCLLIGYPMSYAIVSLPAGRANLVLTLVLLPFWTSALVRATAWMVLLQREGLINGLLLSLDLVTAPVPLIYNRFGVVVAMVHVLLPYMILTLYAVMRGVDPHLVRAARSLGATVQQSFRRVYLPQTMSGVVAGTLLVFILAIGSYVTPALIGGRHDQMISYFIAFNINQSINWGMAAALSTLLLLTVVALYLAFGRIAGVGRVRTL